MPPALIRLHQMSRRVGGAVEVEREPARERYRLAAGMWSGEGDSECLLGALVSARVACPGASECKSGGSLVVNIEAVLDEFGEVTVSVNG